MSEVATTNGKVPSKEQFSANMMAWGAHIRTSLCDLSTLSFYLNTAQHNASVNGDKYKKLTTFIEIHIGNIFKRRDATVAVFGKDHACSVMASTLKSELKRSLENDIHILHSFIEQFYIALMNRARDHIAGSHMSDKALEIINDFIVEDANSYEALSDAINDIIRQPR